MLAVLASICASSAGAFVSMLASVARWRESCWVGAVLAFFGAIFGAIVGLASSCLARFGVLLVGFPGSRHQALAQTASSRTSTMGASLVGSTSAGVAGA